MNFDKSQFESDREKFHNGTGPIPNPDKITKITICDGGFFEGTLEQFGDCFGYTYFADDIFDFCQKEFERCNEPMPCVIETENGTLTNSEVMR